MINGAQYIFVGNRFFVLEEMLKLKLYIKKIFAVSGSYLEKELIKNKIEYESLSSKENLVEYLLNTEFDFLIVNGCQYILPISKLSASGSDKKFINIHPSFLPDLRGADPVHAALLYGRDSGATCHIMNDKIDAGDIISQVKINYSPDYDTDLLYQLTFLAEKQAFADAYKKEFKASKPQVKTEKDIYYSFKPEDLEINFNNDADKIQKRIKAFSNKNKGAQFKKGENIYKVYDSKFINEPFETELLNDYKENQVVFKYGDSIAIKKNKSSLLILEKIEGDLSRIQVGEILN